MNRQVTGGSLMSQESAKLVRTKGSVNEKAKNMGAAMTDERHMGVVSWRDTYAGERHHGVTSPQRMHRCRKFSIFSRVYTLITVTTYYGDVMSERGMYGHRVFISWTYQFISAADDRRTDVSDYLAG